MITERVREAVKVVDDPYWRSVTGSPLATPWYDKRTELERLDKLSRTNPLAHRLISMTTDFVIGGGIKLTGNVWARKFWEHPLNDMDIRAYRWCDELTRSGELFIVLSRNPVNGMSYVREVPALLVDQIETDPEDLEREVHYHELTRDTEGKWWPAHNDAIPLDAPAPAPQIMLHYSINKPVGDTRGASDLASIIPWLERYDMWLEDRVRINRFKGAYLYHVRIENALPGILEAKRLQYSRPPQSGSIIVTDAAEHWEAVQPKIAADDVEADGKAIRLMIAAGAGIPLHFLAEGESATRATAKEMNAPTYRHFAHRQYIFEHILRDVVQVAAARAGKGKIQIDIEFESVLDIDPDAGTDAPAGHLHPANPVNPVNPVKKTKEPTSDEPATD
jgi:hypothetical protein